MSNNLETDIFGQEAAPQLEEVIAAAISLRDRVISSPFDEVPEFSVIIDDKGVGIRGYKPAGTSIDLREFVETRIYQDQSGIWHISETVQQVAHEVDDGLARVVVETSMYPLYEGGFVTHTRTAGHVDVAGRLVDGQHEIIDITSSSDETWRLLLFRLHAIGNEGT